jgi:hypothetical protein
MLGASNQANTKEATPKSGEKGHGQAGLEACPPVRVTGSAHGKFNFTKGPSGSL